MYKPELNLLKQRMKKSTEPNEIYFNKQWNNLQNQTKFIKWKNEIIYKTKLNLLK